MRKEDRHYHIGKTAAVFVLFLFMTAGFPAASFGDVLYQNQTLRADTASVTPGMVDQVVRALEASAGYDLTQKYYLVNTGIYFSDSDAGTLAAGTLSSLILGEKDYFVYYSEGGAPYVDPAESDPVNHIVYVHYDKNPGGYLYVGWFPGADPQKTLAEHRAASDMVKRIVELTPYESTDEKIRHFHDYIRDFAEPSGKENPGHDAYDALVRGHAVCQGYSDAFFNLCFYSGIRAAGIFCTGIYENGELHSYNAVRTDDLVWRGIDVFWDDLDVTYVYFLSDMGNRLPPVR